MKKRIALILAFILIMSLGVAAYADDGTLTTTVTVIVPPGTYTAIVPESVTVLLEDVTSTTNPLGEALVNATVADVENCKYIFCRVTAPILKNGETVLKSSLSCVYLTAALDAAYATDSLEQGESNSYCVYYEGRREALHDREAAIEPVQTALKITPYDGGIVPAGDYVGTMSFYFFYSRHIGS